MKDIFFLANRRKELYQELIDLDFKVSHILHTKITER